jgi:hypothetical protein
LFVPNVRVGAKRQSGCRRERVQSAKSGHDAQGFDSYLLDLPASTKKFPVHLIELEKLEETDVLSISLDQAHLYFEMVVSTYEGTRYALAAWSGDGTRLDITIGALHVRNNLTNTNNIGILGVLESVGFVDDVLILEGDFGDITIKAAKVSIKKLT